MTWQEGLGTKESPLPRNPLSREVLKKPLRYLDIFESPTHYYEVMEKLRGCELTVALSENGAKWSERNSAGVLSDLLCALQHLHDVVGMYHCDVKLENLRFRGRTSGPLAGREVGGGVILMHFLAKKSSIFVNFLENKLSKICKNVKIKVARRMQIL